MNTILLCAGKINYVNLPINTNTSNSMIPVNGKPVIAWILEDLLAKNINEVILVLRAEDTFLKEFLDRVYSSKVAITYVELKDSKSILHSLQSGLELCKEDEAVRVLLGDTMIQDSFDLEGDTIYVHEVDESKRWCLVETNDQGEVQTYWDKVLVDVPKPYFAACGYYHIKDCRYFKDCVEESIQKEDNQISDALIRYQQERKLVIKHAQKWFDFGNIDNLLTSKQRLLQSRYFNTLTIDPILNTIMKVSEFDQKLRCELNWYEQLPSELQVLTPRIISKEEEGGQLHLVQEYYGYPTVAELYLFSDLNIENWELIIKRLIILHQQFLKFTGKLPIEAFRSIYIDKTFDRLEKLKDTDPEWQRILSYDHVELNGQTLNNIYSFEKELKQKAQEVANNARATIIHGDYCFSNILFDINSQIVRLIDPRGSFGEIGIYGDPRYDIAKMRHSLCGAYDYIVSDMFEVKETEGKFDARLFSRTDIDQLSSIFDKHIANIGYDPKEIKFIEALLFISMLPLHKDKPLRQKMMYLNGLTRLNELFVCV